MHLALNLHVPLSAQLSKRPATNPPEFSSALRAQMAYSSFVGPSSQPLTQSTYPSQSTQYGYSQQYALNLTDVQMLGSPSASMSEILLDPLARLQTLSHTLFQSLGPPQTRPPPPPSVSELLAVDAQLAGAMHLARAHQVKQRRIEQLKDEVLDLDRRWRDTVRTLDEGRRELDAIVREGEERIKAIEEAKAGTSHMFLVQVMRIPLGPLS